jgi:hypothetical protein
MLWAARTPCPSPTEESDSVRSEHSRPSPSPSPSFGALAACEDDRRAVSAANRPPGEARRKHKGAFESPELAADAGIFPSRCALRMAESQSVEQRHESLRDARLVGAIVARYRPSRRQMAVEGVSLAGCRVHACIR